MSESHGIGYFNYIEIAIFPHCYVISQLIYLSYAKNCSHYQRQLHIFEMSKYLYKLPRVKWHWKIILVEDWPIESIVKREISSIYHIPMLITLPCGGAKPHLKSLPSTNDINSISQFLNITHYASQRDLNSSRSWPLPFWISVFY